MCITCTSHVYYMLLLYTIHKSIIVHLKINYYIQLQNDFSPFCTSLNTTFKQVEGPGVLQTFSTCAVKPQQINKQTNVQGGEHGRK